MANGEGFFNRINGFELDPELMMGALQAIDEMNPDDRDFEGMTIRIISFIHEETDLTGEDRTDASMAINFRLMALAKLDLLPMPIWRIVGSGKSDPDLLHEDVVRCAATEPLVRDGEDLVFNRDSFTNRLAAMTAKSIREKLQNEAGTATA